MKELAAETITAAATFSQANMHSTKLIWAIGEHRKLHELKCTPRLCCRRVYGNQNWDEARNIVFSQWAKPERKQQQQWTKRVCVCVWLCVMWDEGGLTHSIKCKHRRIIYEFDIKSTDFEQWIAGAVACSVLFCSVVRRNEFRYKLEYFSCAQVCLDFLAYLFI